MKVEPAPPAGVTRSAPSPRLIELGRGISASLDGVTAEATCAVAGTAEVIKASAPANNAISTGTRAFHFICIPSLSNPAKLPLRSVLQILAPRDDIGVECQRTRNRGCSCSERSGSPANIDVIHWAGCSPGIRWNKVPPSQ